MLWTTWAWLGIVKRITPHLHVYPPLCLLYISYSTCSDTLKPGCTIQVLHGSSKFYAVAVFYVLNFLYKLVQGVFFNVKWLINCNIVGFLWQGLSIFKVIVACGMSQHQICMGKWVSVFVSLVIKWSFHVLMAFPAAFTQWFFWGTNWYTMSSCWLYFSGLVDA